MQGFEPDKASAFFRMNEERTIIIRTFTTSSKIIKQLYLDDSAQRSTDGYSIIVTPKITTQYNPIKPFLKGT